MQFQDLDWESILKEVRRGVSKIEFREKSLSSGNGVINRGKRFNVICLSEFHVILSIEYLKNMSLPKGSYILVNEISRFLGSRPFCRYMDGHFFVWEWTPQYLQNMRFNMLKEMKKHFLQWNNSGIL